MKDGPFGKYLPVSEAPTLDGTSGYSSLTGSRWTNFGGPIPPGGSPIYSSIEVPISRTNNGGVVKRIRQISNSPTSPNSEGSNYLYGEEVEVVLQIANKSSSISPSHPPSKKFQIQVILSTPRNFQPVFSTFPSSIPNNSPSSSMDRPPVASPVRPSPIPQPRPSPIFPSFQLQVARESIIREYQSHLTFPATQVFQILEHWPVQVTIEDPNMADEGQDAVARLFRGVDKNNREVISYYKNRMIPGTGSEELVS
ncbi:hypothetical protein O181_028246 [Austropuccinia psidii MF-1]|uniref:Uncharacterized protein n=1 Tax=Austropuccinia psidii MF-1 TaxID=1389203 RepID=A0A9Q3H271_9BASI|nr:hypothetical protein [Austropuccinia psidii MF-1]